MIIIPYEVKQIFLICSTRISIDNNIITSVSYSISLRIIHFGIRRPRNSIALNQTKCRIRIVTKESRHADKLRARTNTYHQEIRSLKMRKTHNILKGTIITVNKLRSRLKRMKRDLRRTSYSTNGVRKSRDDFSNELTLVFLKVTISSSQSCDRQKKRLTYPTDCGPRISSES